MSSPTQVLEQTLQAWPLTDAHRRLLAGVGLHAADLAGLDLGSVPAAGRPPVLAGADLAARDLVVFGGRDSSGNLTTLRVLDARAPFSSPVRDLAADAPFAGCTSFDASGFRYRHTPHVTIPPESQDGVAVVVDDDLSAAVLAPRLRVPVVSTLGGRLLAPALKVAARLAQERTLIVAIGRGHSDPRNRLLSRAVALAGMRTREVRVADWEGPAASLAAAVLANHPYTTHAAPRALPTGRGDVARPPCAVPLPPLTRRPANAVKTAVVRAGWGMTRAVLGVAEACAAMRAPVRLGPPAPAYAHALRAVSRAAEVAAASGARLAMIGGAAVDAIAGGVVRGRRDVDLLLEDVSGAMLDRIAEAIGPLGFSVRRRICGGYLSFNDGNITIELFRAFRDADGRVLFVNGFQYSAFDAEALDGGPRLLNGTPVPVLAPEYLYLLLEARNRDAPTLSVRSELVRKSGKIDDLRALRPHVDPARLRHVRAADRFRCYCFEPDPIRAAEAELARVTAPWKRKVERGPEPSEEPQAEAA